MEISTQGGLAKPTLARVAHRTNDESGRRASTNDPAFTAEGKAALKMERASSSESK
jgi:hypothetical protein